MYKERGKFVYMPICVHARIEKWNIIFPLMNTAPQINTILY